MIGHDVDGRLIINTSLVALAKDLDVQLAKVVALFPECRVVASEDDIQDAVKLLALSDAQQSLLEGPVSI